MLILTNAGTDSLEVVTDAAVTVDVSAHWVDRNTSTFEQVLGRTNTAISTAATTPVIAAPAATTVRIVKTLHVCNIHATSSVGVTVQYDQNGTNFRLHNVTLLAGEQLEYVEGIGFFVVAITRKAFFLRRVTSDSVHATAASFADVTGLTCPVFAGKHYNFVAHLYHVENASTTGAQFAINGPAVTAMLIQEWGVFAGSITASTAQASLAVAGITARDTAAIVATSSAATPQIALAMLTGWFNPSADGTFAVRATSEVSVAAGLTVKAGSWLQLWEADN